MKIQKLTEEKKRTTTTKCPKCGSRSFVISIFGSICGKCFYKEKVKEKRTPKKEFWEKDLLDLLEFTKKEVIDPDRFHSFVSIQIKQSLQQERERIIR